MSCLTSSNLPFTLPLASSMTALGVTLAIAGDVALDLLGLALQLVDDLAHIVWPPFIGREMHGAYRSRMLGQRASDGT